MKPHVQLPETKQDLESLNLGQKAALWARYSPYPFKRQIRSLWYYIQCERLHLQIEPKYLSKIKKYKDNPAECISRVYQRKYSIAPGTIITRTFRGIEHKILVNDDRTFTYKDQKFKSLSAIAKEIAGIKISGPDFFGLNKRSKHGD